MKLKDKLLESIGLGPRPAQSAAIVVPWLVERFHPATLADIGCGSGAWLAEFQKLGVDGYGYDRKYRHGWMKIPRYRFCEIDLNCDAIPVSQFDLILCLEVAEHVQERAAGRLVETLTGMSPVIVFGAGIPLQGGSGHVNEQWQSYWAERFSARNYLPHSDLRREFWNNSDVAPWYRQDTIIYASPETARKFDLHRADLLDVVHPESWSSIGAMGLMQRLFHSL